MDRRKRNVLKRDGGNREYESWQIAKKSASLSAGFWARNEALSKLAGIAGVRVVLSQVSKSRPPPHEPRPVRGDPGPPPHEPRPVRGDPGPPPHKPRPVRGDPGAGAPRFVAGLMGRNGPRWFPTHFRKERGNGWGTQHSGSRESMLSHPFARDAKGWCTQRWCKIKRSETYCPAYCPALGAK
jgi:hypothetical protein